jgi:hypothetical protein
MLPHRIGMCYMWGRGSFACSGCRIGDSVFVLGWKGLTIVGGSCEGSGDRPLPQCPCRHGGWGHQRGGKGGARGGLELIGVVEVGGMFVLGGGEGPVV